MQECVAPRSWALGAGVLTTFIIALMYNRGDWALSLVHTLLFAVVILVGARVAIGANALEAAPLKEA